MVTCHFKKNPPENLSLKAGGFGVVGEKKGGGGDGLVRKNGGEHDRCRRLGWSPMNSWVWIWYMTEREWERRIWWSRA